MNGPQMVDTGRALRRAIRTLFITGYAESAAIGDAALGMGMQVLTKPFTIDVLPARIRGLMKI